MSKRLDDGFPTIISFGTFPTVLMWEKSVTPAGWTMGGANDTSNMRNVEFMTSMPKKLKAMTPASARMAYDPTVRTTVRSMLGVLQLMTFTYSDATTEAWWGWLNAFTPHEITFGAPALADIEILPALQNAALVETPPVIVAGP